MIKLETLRVFATVAELGNIKDAADRLGRTASAVSMTLKQLEDELGSRLFQSDRKNALTALGQFVFENSRSQVAGYDKALSAIRAYAEGRSGPVAIASVPSVAASLLPALIPEFVAERPGIAIELFDTDSRTVAAMVQSGRVDLGIAGQPVSGDLLTFEPLFCDTFKVVCSTASPLTEIDRPLEWDDLVDHPLIMNNAVRLLATPAFQKLAANANLTVYNVTSLLAMTRTGLGVTLLPALATVDLPDGIAKCDIADPDAERQVGLVTRPGVSVAPAVAAFREHLFQKLPGELHALGLRQ